MGGAFKTDEFSEKLQSAFDHVDFFLENHAQKALFKNCNRIFWIENDHPTPLWSVAEK